MRSALLLSCSLGVVLWEIVTHEVPIRGALRLPTVPEECPQGVVDVIASCMALNPDERPSAREVHDALAACPPFDPRERRAAEEAQHSRDWSGKLAGSPMGHLSPRMGSLYSVDMDVSSDSGGSGGKGSGGGAGGGGWRQAGSQGPSGAGTSSSLARVLEAVSPRLMRVVHQIRARMQHGGEEEGPGEREGAAAV